ncbi:aspartic peptidase domain-containing protein [Rhizoctonia solani]|nr:aspartic peptidase domain-containing protein [Rhizoctonia solani]
MTVVFVFVFGLVSSWLWAVEAGSSKLELVVKPRGDERLLRRGNATVEYLKYGAQSYNALTTIGEYSFLLSLDTGSADTWVVSSSCRTAECKGLPAYPEHLTSPTFGSINNNHTAFKIGFADGTRATGLVASERMGVGGFNLTSQVFGLVNDTNVTLSVGDHEASGVLGLGFPRLSQIGKAVPGAIPPVARLAQQGALSYPMFGLSLRKNDTGTLSLGAIDADVVKNQSLISWHNVAPFPTLLNDNSSIYLQWAIHLSGVAVHEWSQRQLNSTYPATTGSQPLALFDLGANGIYGPTADVAELFSQIPASRLVGDGQYAIPCDTTLRMSFTFGSRNYTLQPHDYIFSRVINPSNMCLAWPRATAPSEDGIDWQFGTPFMRTVYSIFRASQIGLYPVSPDVVIDTEESISQSSTTTPSPSGTASSPTSTFEYSVPTLGEPASSGLGASTYSALLTRTTPLPSAHAPVVVVTDSNGSATTQAMPMQSVILGGPEINSASRPWTFGFGLWTGLLSVVYVILLI